MADERKNFTFNIAGGSNFQNSQFGENQMTNNYHGSASGSITPEVYFAEVSRLLKQELPEDEFATVEQSTIKPLQELSVISEEADSLELVGKYDLDLESGNDDSDGEGGGAGPEEIKQTLFARIKPYANIIAKASLAFGEGAVEALAASNPIIRGTLAAIKELRKL